MLQQLESGRTGGSAYCRSMGGIWEVRFRMGLLQHHFVGSHNVFILVPLLERQDASRYLQGNPRRLREDSIAGDRLRAFCIGHRPIDCQIFSQGRASTATFEARIETE